MRAGGLFERKGGEGERKLRGFMGENFPDQTGGGKGFKGANRDGRRRSDLGEKGFPIGFLKYMFLSNTTHFGGNGPRKREREGGGKGPPKEKRERFFGFFLKTFFFLFIFLFFFSGGKKFPKKIYFFGF